MLVRKSTKRVCSMFIHPVLLAEGDCAVVHSIVDKQSRRRQKDACWAQNADTAARNADTAARISTEVRRSFE